jgi:non-heme chloroperoxidase
MILQDGTKLFVICQKKKNDRPPFVFLHGDGQNHTVWTKFMNFFFKVGNSVLCYDLPGHGLSQPYKDGKYSFPKFAETLKQILDEYRIKKPVLVGNSTGGMTAFQFATDNPDKLKSVVAVSSCDCSPSKYNPEILPMVNNFIEKSRKLFKKQQVIDYSKPIPGEEDIIASTLTYTSPEAIKGNLEAMKRYDISSKLGKIRMPVLLFRGEKDVFISRGWMRRIKEEIPISKLITVQGYGHHVLLQAPEKIFEGIVKNYSFLVQK